MPKHVKLTEELECSDRQGLEILEEIAFGVWIWLRYNLQKKLSFVISPVFCISHSENCVGIGWIWSILRSPLVCHSVSPRLIHRLRSYRTIRLTRVFQIASRIFRYNANSSTRSSDVPHGTGSFRIPENLTFRDQSSGLDRCEGPLSHPINRGILHGRRGKPVIRRWVPQLGYCYRTCIIREQGKSP